MMLLFVSLVSLLCLSSAKPYVSVAPQNVVTVPPNCPPGQEYVNGICRDVWRRQGEQESSGPLTEQDVYNFVRVLGPMFEHQQSIEINLATIIRLPEIKCPEGFKRDVHGKCRPVS